MESGTSAVWAKSAVSRHTGSVAERIRSHLHLQKSDFQVVLSAENGKPAICEKPLGRNAANGTQQLNHCFSSFSIKYVDLFLAENNPSRLADFYVFSRRCHGYNGIISSR